jgi:hypothetical protein
MRSTRRITRRSAPRCRRRAAAEQSASRSTEDRISSLRLAAVALATLAGLVPSRLAAQAEAPEPELTDVWRIAGLQNAFCVQLLIDPAKLNLDMPADVRPLRADAVQSLTPPLQTVITNQPEFAAWSPSSICMYYMETVDVGPVRVSESDPDKAPMIGMWSIAAADSGGGTQRDYVLRLFTNSGRLERAGELRGLNLRTVRSTVREVSMEDDEAAVPVGTRYQFKLGKTLLTWDGRKVDDSTRASGQLSSAWRTESRRGDPMAARLVLAPKWTKSMVGFLRVEGKDDFAKAIMASPIRFVGPARLGGGGEFAFGR